MRWLPLALILFTACKEDEAPPPICPDVCEDFFEVVVVGTELSLYDMAVSFDSTALTFTCNGGNVKKLDDDTYEVDCDDTGFSIEGATPAQVSVSLNDGVYEAVLDLAYTSHHPNHECVSDCMGASVEWSLFD